LLKFHQKRDGPSGGCAIVVGIISRLCGVAVRNDVAMTGEIAMSSKILAIGGLYAKLQGCIRAGIKKAIIPFDNKSDYEKIINSEDDIDLMSSGEFIPLNEEVTKSKKKKVIRNKTIKNDLKIVFAKDIFEVLKHALVKNDLKFNKVY